MTPEMLEACAKLCGWWQIESCYVDESHDALAIFLDKKWKIVPAGLLAVEDALLQRGWCLEILGDDGGTPCYGWSTPIRLHKHRLSIMHPDRAVAAAMAAMEEVK